MTPEAPSALPLPDGLPATVPVRAAFEVLVRSSPAALVHHAVRSTLLAADLGLRLELPVDDEVLAVAGLLHDTGLTPGFDAHAAPFEVAGGNVAWAVTAGAGWAPERRDRTARAVVDHMLDDDEVPPHERPEGYLLARSTGADVSGRGLEHWPAAFRDDLEARWPRLDFRDLFSACLRDQAARKPSSVVAAYVAAGGADRVR
ncbi:MULTISPECIES: HD domain-containing protein [unclassified Isoptericola]|uniref:HD domain-containing protein n=1 Tax=unclassified Isoptericola TaxID=2623355 RepID=UPI003660A61B